VILKHARSPGAVRSAKTLFPSTRIRAAPPAAMVSARAVIISPRAMDEFTLSLLIIARKKNRE
jgi:hypothetical protein